MLNFRSVKTQLILYLACFALFISFKDKDAAFLATTAIAVTSCLALESSFLYLKNKVFQLTESPLITGLIIGFVLSGSEAWWKFVLASVLAILPKYLIRFKGKHIFNPAGLGIFLTLLFFNASTQWKGTYLWYVLLPFGLYFSYKFRKMGIIIGYALAFFALSGFQAVSQKIPLGHIFGYLSYFYIFIMVIEPKTTPVKQAGKLIFGALASSLIFILTALGAGFDVELFSLLVLNTAVPALNKIS